MAPATPQTPTSPFPSPNTVQPSSLSRLTLSDKLLLSQAVHHIGTSPPDWGRVSSILLAHPLIKTRSRLEQAAKAGITLGRVFGSRECERAWVALMRQYNLVLQPGERDTSIESDGETSGSPALANRAKEARGLPAKTDRGSQLALAQFLYAERIREIQDQIKLKEATFTLVVNEIEALNSGALDERLLEELERSGLLREQAAAEATASDALQDTLLDEMTPTPSQSTPGRSGRMSRGASVSSMPDSSPTKAAPESDLPLSMTQSDEIASAETLPPIFAGEQHSDTSQSSPHNSHTAARPQPSPVDVVCFERGAHEQTLDHLEKSSEKVGSSVPDTKRIRAEPSVNVESHTAQGHEVAVSEDKTGVGVDVGRQLLSVEQNTAETASAAAIDREEAGASSIGVPTKRKRSDADLPSDEQHPGEASAGQVLPAPRKRARSIVEVTPEHDQEAEEIVQQATQSSSAETQVTSEANIDNALPIGQELSDESGAPGEKGSTDENDKNEVVEGLAKEKEDDETEDELERSAEVSASASQSPLPSAEPDDMGTYAVDLKVIKILEDEGEEEAEAEEAETSAASGVHPRPEPRRSRRSVRKLSTADEQLSTQTSESLPPSALAGAKNSRDALRSREASGGSLEPDEERVTDEGAASTGRAAAEPRSRSSISPSIIRRGRGGSRTGRRGPRGTSDGGPDDSLTAGSDAERERAAQVVKQRKVEKVLLMLLNEVSNHTHGNLFHAPIKESDAPDYYALIRHPLDLKTIKARIKDGRITTATQLRRALMQMFANSLIYNRPGSEIHRMALEMRDAAEEMMDRFEQTQMSAHASRR